MIFSIALNVGAYFLFPKFRIVLRPHKIVTTLMPMPETTVYKDHRLIFGKNNIRFSWKTSVIFSVSESLRKQVFSDKFFWFSILSTNTGHIIASGFRRMDIGHNNPPFQLVFVVVFQFLTTYSRNRSFIGYHKFLAKQNWNSSFYKLSCRFSRENDSKTNNNPNPDSYLSIIKEFLDYSHFVHLYNLAS